VSGKVSYSFLKEKLSTKASKLDYGELSKLYSKIVVALDPLIRNEGTLKNLIDRVTADKD
jgi:hypothetical protein